MRQRQGKESGLLACTHTEKCIVCRSDKKNILVNSHKLKNSTKINHDLIIDLLFCFVTKMMSIVLSINIDDRRQKAKELVLEIAT